ncbi:hypothetical protein CHU98_g6612 [Xylaria longipes]|nr:hypothetical protein CHU98_g6612 [Xylaria longipes]
MRLGRAAIGPSLCNEVSLSNQLTPFDAGNPAPTPDRPANERSAWRLDVPPLSHVKCKSLHLVEAAQSRLRSRASPRWSCIPHRRCEAAACTQVGMTLRRFALGNTTFHETWTSYLLVSLRLVRVPYPAYSLRINRAGSSTTVSVSASPAPLGVLLWLAVGRRSQDGDQRREKLTPGLGVST